MKKLFVILVALLFGVALGFGQHIDVITQTGNTNQATTQQFFDGNGPVKEGNIAYTTQIGNDNIGNITQGNNGFGGSAEFAQIFQDGGENQAYIQQHNDGHKAYISQFGYANNSQVNQWGNKTEGTVTELGNGNTGIINIYGVAPVTGVIVQTGNSNQAYQDLGEAGAYVTNSNFTVSQNDIGNYSKQYMEGKGFPGGITVMNNHGSVFQDGSENIADQEMLLDPVTGLNQNNAGSVMQVGDDNYAKQFQYGVGQLSTIVQTGNGNSAVSIQN